jgi:hypothetical protein
MSKDFGANKHLLFSISIPITSGFTASGSTLNIVPLTTSNLLFQSLVDQVGDQVLTLSPNTEIYIGVTSTVTASKNIYLIAQLEDF